MINGQASIALSRAINIIKDSCRDLYKLNEITSDKYSYDISQRLHIAVNFIKDSIELLDEERKNIGIVLRINEHKQKTFYDHITDLMFEIIVFASAVNSSPDQCWAIQYIGVWSQFFDFTTRGKAWIIIHYKLRRLLYTEICRLNEFPNYNHQEY